MRTILLSLSLVILTLQASAQTQITNSNFESWETTTDETAEPVNWNSFMSASGGLAMFAGEQMDRSTIVRPGSSGIYSVRIWTRDATLALANGNITLGRVNMGNSSPTNAANYNRSVQNNTQYSEAFTNTPDSLVVWLRYNKLGSGNDSARLSFIIHKNIVDFKDPGDENGTNVVAKAVKNIPYTGNNWVRYSIPFVYTGQPVSSAAYILGTLTSCKTPGGGTENDALLIDDLELIYVPKASFTNTTATICEGGNVTFTSTSTNYPTSYSWNYGDGTPNGTTANPVHQYTTAGTYNVTLTVTNQWGSTTSTPVTVTVTAPDDATFSYAQTSYCSNASNPVPTVVDAGTFTAPAGLSINATTGVIDLAASTPGTYTVTNTTSSTCPDTKTTSITITPAANATFNYPSNTICLSDGNQTPTTFEAGTFSSTTGLVFVSTTTGEINVAGSTSGTYTITYNVGGACPNSSQVNVTLTATPDAAFSYANPAYCANATDPAPVFGAGANGGVFSSTTGLTINSNSGIIDLSASTAGTYTVTNTITAVGSCPADVETTTIIVNALPTVALGNFTDVCVYNPAFTLSGGTPAGGSYSGTGVSGGNFNPATAGVGPEIITYSYTDATTTCSNTATSTISVEECLGLNDNEMNLISVYPNPTDGKLTLSNISGNTAFKVVAVSGQVVSSGSVSATANTLDLSSFENGIYVLQLAQEQGLQTIRIVKK